MTLIYIVFGVAAVLILWVIFSYNRLIALVNRAEEAWSDYRRAIEAPV